MTRPTRRKPPTRRAVKRKATRVARVPRSHATNAYDLLEDVKQAIQEEPKRIDMAHWILKRSALKRKGRKTIPACGTVGCIAGWVTLLTRRDKPAYPVTRPDEATDTVKFIARSILTDGQDWSMNAAIQNLFFGNYRRSSVYGGIKGYGRPGSQAHARRVIEDISTFQGQYEHRLKARQVPQEQHA